MEFGEANGELKEPATSGERRPSVEALHKSLKRVSQSPFHSQYQMSTPADIHHQRYPAQNGLLTMDNDVPPAAQNGVDKASPRTNPFYSYFLESAGKSNDTSTRTSEEAANVSAIFVPPPEFQSSPLDQPDTASAQPTLYSQNDTFNNFAPKTTLDIFQNSPSFHNVTLDTPDIFKTAQSSASHNGYTSDIKAGDVFTGTEESFVASKEVNKSFKAADSLFPKSVPNINPFYNSTTNDSASSKTYDIFNKENQSPAFVQSNDIFSRASNDKFDIFSTSAAGLDSADLLPISVTRNIDFSSIEDPFADSPLQLSDPFQDASLDTSDVFKPILAKAEGGNGGAKVVPPRPTPPRPTPPKPKPPRPTPPRPSPLAIVPRVAASTVNKPEEIVLTSPEGSQRSILQPAPLIPVQSQSVSPSQSPKLTHVSTFKRPPKPLPRIRRSRTLVPSKPTPPEKPLKPERPSPPALPTLVKDTDVPEPVKSPDLTPPKPPLKPPLPKLSPKPSLKPLLPKPVIRRKPKSKDKQTVDPENYVVFEDILLIGQEHCVEDWPEDSPEVQPNFKPRGTFRLRRESLMPKTDSETEDPEGPGSSVKKKDNKFKMSVSSRRDSKERFSDECTSRSRTNSSTKLSKEYFADEHYSSQELKRDENEDPEQWVDYKKPHFKNRVSSLLRRSSASAAFTEQKHMNGNVPREPKGSEFKKGKTDPFRRHSEGTMLDPGSGESGDDTETKKNRKLRGLKFVPNKALVFNKQNEDELKGAHGFTPQQGSKEDLFGAHSSYSTRKKSQDDGLDSFNKAALMNDDYSEKSLPPQHDFNDEFAEDIDALKGKQALSPTEMYNYDEDQLDICQPKKTFKLKAFKKPKLKSKSMHLQKEEPPGATSSDYMSEAAKAELMAAEKDRYAMDEFDDGEGDGDTDSLMEWWDTVEQWDEVPSDEEEMTLKEDESKSFSILADKAQRAVRLFIKVFMERAEVLWQSVITLHTIADDISTFHNKARIAGITGGTTTAVGGVAAIAGLALAPVTFGASLVVTAVGVGIATAGGITSASAAISDNVNNANDRKKVEALLLENEASLLELSKILHFANTGLYKLRGHPFLRSGTQHYSQDWGVRQAVQMIGTVDSPVMKATDFIDSAVSSVQGLFQGMDKYFLKDSRELKKGCKKEIVAQIKDVANVLNDCIVELNVAREELQEAMGEV